MYSKISCVMETKYIVIGIFILIIISTAIVLIYQLRTGVVGGIVPFKVEGRDENIIAVVPLTAETAKSLAQQVMQVINNTEIYNFTTGYVSKKSNIWTVYYGCKEGVSQFPYCGVYADINENTQQIKIYGIN